MKTESSEDEIKKQTRTRVSYALVTLMALPMLLVVAGVDEGNPAEQQVHTLQILYVLIVGTALLALRSERLQKLSGAVAIFVFGAVCGLETTRAVLVGGSSWMWAFLAVLALATGIVLPWGFQYQFMVAVIIAAAVSAYALLTGSGATAGLMGAIGAAVLSVFVAYARDAQRRYASPRQGRAV